MARISGVDIPREKRVVISLTYIHGIGPTSAKKIVDGASVSPDTRTRDLTEDEVNRLREIIDRRYKVEGDLRREVSMNIKRLMEIGVVPRPPPSAQLAGAWAAHEDQRPPAARRRAGRSASVARSDPQSHARPHRPDTTGVPWLSESARRVPRSANGRTFPVGHAHIQSTFNNTIVTITDTSGNVISWGSAGLVGFKGSRKSTPYAAAQTAEGAAQARHGARHAPDRGLREGSRCGPRAGDPLAAVRRPGRDRDHRRHAHPPQRLPPAQAAPGLRGARPRWHATPTRSAASAAAKGSSFS